MPWSRQEQIALFMDDQASDHDVLPEKQAVGIITSTEIDVQRYSKSGRAIDEIEEV